MQSPRPHERDVHERFGAAGVRPGDIRCARDTYTFRFDGPPAGFLDVLRHCYGPTMNADAAAATAGREDRLHDEMTRLFAAENRGTAQETIVPAAFLRVEATVR